ncbi:uncharacterized protein JCM6883_001745 [Sporobolomyces salmoneus]|uniref:uncharacterized protein n=1 Tax=Sporobolomyces salmoneus TaxID=183962 RepID=UPI0031814BA2
MDRLQESRAIANSVHNWAECHRVNRKLVDALRVLISATTFELGATGDRKLREKLGWYGRLGTRLMTLKQPVTRGNVRDLAMDMRRPNDFDVEEQLFGGGLEGKAHEISNSNEFETKLKMKQLFGTSYEEIGRLWEEGTRSTEGLKGKLVEKLVDLNPKDKNYELCAAQVRHFDMVMELDE